MWLLIRFVPFSDGGVFLYLCERGAWVEVVELDVPEAEVVVPQLEADPELEGGLQSGQLLDDALVSGDHDVVLVRSPRHDRTDPLRAAPARTRGTGRRRTRHFVAARASHFDRDPLRLFCKIKNEKTI